MFGFQSIGSIPLCHFNIVFPIQRGSYFLRLDVYLCQICSMIKDRTSYKEKIRFKFFMRIKYYNIIIQNKYKKIKEKIIEERRMCIFFPY